MIKLLTLKHWQLFGLLIGFPMILQFVAIGLIISGANPKMLFYLFPVMFVLFTALYFGWFYALGTNLHRKLPTTAPMNRAFLLIPILYMLLISILVVNTILDVYAGAQLNLPLFALIIPVHFFSMLCIFYCLYFNARALKTVELQRPATFSDFAGEFFMMWFFPIGIWILQPRINKLFDKTSNEDYNQTLSVNTH